jgi:aminopeptidase N
MLHPNGISTGFELPGTAPQYPPSSPFKIEYMCIIIQPNLKSKDKNLDNCTQYLNITSKKENLNEIELDIAEIKVQSVSYSHALYETSDNKTIQQICNSLKNVEYNDNDEKKPDKLIIQLPEALEIGKTFCLAIKYSAGHYEQDRTIAKTPRSGFHFIQPDAEHPDKKYQAWTQGESTESRYWFPCFDHPELKFPWEIHVIVPEEFVVISNGNLEPIKPYTDTSNNANKSDKKFEWIWKEPIPNAAYLASVVVGTFVKKSGSYDSIPLEYYWSKDIEEKHYDPMLTFNCTPDVMKFFVYYLHTNYPYNKYSQVAVEDFEYGGMENTSCTTLIDQYFHNEEVIPDFTSDTVVVRHELAHQWFGDLVTCKDWQHLWLNEGFATYFEALYLDREHIMDPEHHPRIDEFQYYLITSIMDVYMVEAAVYKRPIVTTMYKHPDDLDDGHTYQKGAFVLHMLRNYINEKNFRESLKQYLIRYRYSTAESDDLRKVCEEVSGISLQQFFYQWIYTKGHPILDIELSLDNSQLSVIIRQVSDEKSENNEHKEKPETKISTFNFQLDVKLWFSSGTNNESEIHTFDISEIDHTLKIDIDPTKVAQLKYVSTDPELKVLKEIRSFKVTNGPEHFQRKELLKQQLKYGESIVERIDAARLLGEETSEDVINALKESITTDPFYGVSIEAASTLGSFSEKSDDVKTQTYNKLLTLFQKEINNKEPQFSQLDSRIKATLVASLANFGKKESLQFLFMILEDKNPFVARQAATGIGKCSTSLTDIEQKKNNIEKLKSIVTAELGGSFTFRNNLARGAISGLGQFSADADEQIVRSIADVIVDASEYGRDYLIRQTAIPTLGKFLRYNKVNKENQEVIETKVIENVFNQLKNVLKSKQWSMQVAACQAFVSSRVTKPDEKLIETINELTWIAEHDPDGMVRREAEVSVNNIRQWIDDWLDAPPKIVYKIREDADKLQEHIVQARQNHLKLF